MPAEPADKEIGMFRKLDDSISVSEQITPADVEAAAALGFKMIINNRPDDEQPGQPAGADIREAARDHGLAYVAIPITHSGYSTAQVDAMRDALAKADGPVLAFCRSGTRSTFAWALARGADGEDAEVLATKAAQAGYDISPVRAFLAAR
jgi:uncharacterized protein (TIGR01244 family)